MQSVASTLNIEIYFLNKSGREKRLTVANWLKCKGSPENNLLFIFCQRKTDEYCPSTHPLSPPVVWITSYQVPLCNLPWRELEPSQRICSCLRVSVCGHTVVGRGVSGDVSERLSLNYAGNLKVLSHCCFEAEWIKKEAFRKLLTCTSWTEKKRGTVCQNTEANPSEHHGEGYVTHEERLG